MKNEKNNSFLAPFLPSLSRKRKPDMEFVHKFLGLKTHKSQCKVEIWKDRAYAVVIFTNGSGTSVTNAAEQLVEEIYNLYLASYLKGCCLFIETYDKTRAINVILPIWKGDRVNGVDWRYLGKILQD